MCTVTYIPQGKGRFILTSNRDEKATRSPKNISREDRKAVQLIFPRDTRAGGTWIASSSDDRLVCLLNGAFKKHERKLPYRQSRGLMVLQFFDYPNANSFKEHFEFNGMEPFTMIIYDQGSLSEIRWDEQLLHERALSPSDYHIWSSSTLYNTEFQNKRAQWFSEFLGKQAKPTFEDILYFHHNGGEGDPWNDVIMNRNGLVQTVSITSIIKQTDQVIMRYEDLLNQDVQQSEISLNREVVESN